jgi:hypothetical protein
MVRGQINATTPGSDGESEGGEALQGHGSEIELLMARRWHIAP